jgi:Tfp pilus assembly protein PilW
MTPLPHRFCSGRTVRRKATQGFTLAEALISATLFLLLLGGIIGANLFGMRMFQLTQTKLKAGDGGRKALGLLTDNIQRCNSTWVGDVTNGTFVALLDGEPQKGSALLIQPSTNPTNFAIYFLNASDQSFRRLISTSGTTTILAENVTNRAIFRAQDCLGNVLTNTQGNRVIHVTLEFFQPQPWLPAGDYSKLETSVTRRRID